jgi:hypothetical protein
MSNTNNGLMFALAGGPWPVNLNDNLALGSGTTQAAAQVCMRSGANRIVSSGGAGASCIMPAMGNDDESGNIVWVINDSANAIAVFAAPGETMNGTSNGSLSIAAGAFAVFLCRPPSVVMRYQGTPAVNSYDWRCGGATT